MLEQAKKNRYSMLVIKILVFIIIIGVLLMADGRAKIINLEGKLIYFTDTKRVNDEVHKMKLANWVFDNSQKISRGQAKQIVEEAMKCQDPILVLAIMKPESEYNPSAISHMGAKGLGQIMWRVWGKKLIERGICKEERDLFDPYINIRAINYVLIVLSEEQKHPVKTLEAYVGGKEKRYVSDVLITFAQLALIK